MGAAAQKLWQAFFSIGGERSITMLRANMRAYWKTVYFITKIDPFNLS